MNLMKHPLNRVALARPLRTMRVEAGAWWYWLALSGLLLAALVLRIWTISQVLPYVDHPDEPNPIAYVITMLRTGDPNQQFFQKPSLYIYLLLSALQAHYAWGRASGLYPPISTMLITTHTVTTVPGFFLTARLVTALFGALTVLSAYALCVRGWSRGAGLVGALFVALLPFHLRFSQWATTDVLASFLVSLSLGAALVVLQTGRWQAYLVAGAFAGLAASAKYNAGAVAGAIIVASALRMLPAIHRSISPQLDSMQEGPLLRRVLAEFLKLGLAGLAAMASFIAGTPYAVLRWGQVSGGIARQWNNYGGANGHYRGAWNISGYSEFFLGDGLGLVACLFVLAGLALLARRRPAVLGVWLGFAAPSLLIHLSRPTHFMQNMLPLLVACALPIGVAVVELPTSLSRRAPALRPVLLVVLVLALALPLAARSLAYVGRQAAGDSRLELMAWLEQHGAPGSRIAAELKAVPTSTEARWTDVPALPAHDMAWYRAQGYTYLVASSNRWGQFEPPAAYQPFLAGLVSEFGPHEHQGSMTGPRLLLIATGLSPDDVPLPRAETTRIGGARLLGVAVGDPSADGEPPMLNPDAPLRPGGVLGLRSFWQVEQAFTQDYLIFVHLIDAQGNRPAQRDAPPWQGRFPTSSWKPGSLVVDANDLYLPPELSPGVYRVMIGMYDPLTGLRAPLSVNGQAVAAGMVEVAQITLAP